MKKMAALSLVLMVACNSEVLSLLLLCLLAAGVIGWLVREMDRQGFR